MQNQTEILKLRILLYFIKHEPDDCTVTKIARALCEEKYTISRVIAAFEKDNIVMRVNPRRLVLTDEGEKQAITYDERVEIIMTHLMYEGVDADSAKHDALNWALCSSEQSIEMFRSAEVRYHVKYEMREKKYFSGEILCARMKDGIYKFPFVIYREQIENGNNISRANGAFENPCILCVKNGVGTIQLRTQVMITKSGPKGMEIRGRVKNIKYLDNGSYVNAEYCGNIVTFPASALNFINVGSEIGQILQGSVCMKMGSIVDDEIMPEYTTMFSILI